MVVLLLIRLIPVRRRFGARRKRLPVEVLYFPAAIDLREASVSTLAVDAGL